MNWLLAGLAGIGFVELFLHLPVRQNLTRAQSAAARALWVVRSDGISDHWKEKTLLRYSLVLFTSACLLGTWLALAFLPFLLAYAISLAIAVPFLEFTLSLAGILFVTAISASYAFIRVGHG